MPEEELKQEGEKTLTGKELWGSFYFQLYGSQIPVILYAAIKSGIAGCLAFKQERWQAISGTLSSTSVSNCERRG